MTNKNDENTPADQENIGNIPTSPLLVHRQYLKDLSFENPNAPAVLRHVNIKPETDINIGIDVQKIESDEFEDYYEVLLNITANTVRDGVALFVADITYGASVSVRGLEEKQHHPLLFIEVPKLIFPFARQIMSHITQSGGFVALQLSPVDFRSMYIKRFAENTENTDETA